MIETRRRGKERRELLFKCTGKEFEWKMICRCCHCLCNRDEKREKREKREKERKREQKKKKRAKPVESTGRKTIDSFPSSTPTGIITTGNCHILSYKPISFIPSLTIVSALLSVSALSLSVQHTRTQKG
jgi:hypothetical protein